MAYLQNVWKPRSRSILHLAPEKLLYDHLKDNDNRVTTADFDPKWYRDVDPDCRQEDATGFSFADASFDGVLANHVMEHIPDDKKAAGEIARVLKPGGRAILQTPYSTRLSKTLEDLSIDNPAEQARLFGQQDHIRIYALNDYLNRLSESGLEVQTVQQAEMGIPDVPFQPGEVIIVGFKRE